MNELLKIILSLSLSGALLILVLLLCKPLAKDKLSKRWQYYIWLIVVVRLLLPFAPETNLMGMAFQYFDNTMIQTDTSLQPEQEPSALPETDFSVQHNVPGQAGTGDGEQLEPEKVAAPGIFEMVKQNIAVICFLVWLLVAACLLIRKITVYQSFVKYIKAGRIEISDMQLWERVGKLVEQTGIKGAVGLYTNSLISSPLLIGFFRPCIMLPTTELSESDFEYTILHELTHYRRRDMFYKWLVQVTICFHWFNPFVYLMGREVNRACELSCDEAVIKSLDEGGRLAYGDTLLNAMGMGGSYKDSIASVTLSEGTVLLKERLDAIMAFKKKSKLVIAISFLLTLLVTIGASSLGAYAATSKDDISKMEFHTSRYYFADTYIIKVEWNINPDNYAKTVQMNVSGSLINIAFDDVTQNAIDTPEMINAIKQALAIQMKEYQDSGSMWMDIVSPAITDISGPYVQPPNDLANLFYEKNNLSYFRAVLPFIEQNTVNELYERAFQENNSVFFRELLGYVPNEEKVSLSSGIANSGDDTLRILKGELSTTQLIQLAEQMYQNNNVDKFKTLMGDLPTETLKLFFKRAYDDNKADFVRVLKNEFSSEEIMNLFN